MENFTKSSSTSTQMRLIALSMTRTGPVYLWKTFRDRLEYGRLYWNLDQRKKKTCEGVQSQAELEQLL